MSREFQGGTAEGWDAVALGSTSTARVRWTEAAMVQYLRTGFHPDHGAALGPMAPVTENLGEIAEEDVAAIAHYIMSFETRAPAAEAKVPGVPARVNAPQSGLFQRRHKQRSQQPDPADPDGCSGLGRH